MRKAASTNPIPKPKESIKGNCFYIKESKLKFTNENRELILTP